MSDYCGFYFVTIVKKTALDRFNIHPGHDIICIIYVRVDISVCVCECNLNPISAARYEDLNPVVTRFFEKKKNRHKYSKSYELFV